MTFQRCLSDTLPGKKKITFVFICSVLLYPLLLFHSLSLSHTVCPVPCSPCVVLISDRHCSRSQRGTEAAAHDFRGRGGEKKGKKRKHIGKQHSPDVSLFFSDVFLISLTSHPPLTTKHPFRVAVTEPLCWFFCFFFFFFGWQLHKPSPTRGEEEYCCIDVFIWDDSATDGT